MKIITVAVIKGGTGKTTTAAALAQAAAHKGKKVLAVDLDPQANLTTVLGAQNDVPGIYEAMTDKRKKPNGFIQSTAQSIDVLGANKDLSALETSSGSAYRLSNVLESLRGEYDLIIVDTPPAMGEHVFNALMAADSLVIPLEADKNSLEGLFQIYDLAQSFKEVNKGLEIKGALLTRFDGRPILNRQFKEIIEKRCTELDVPYLQTIRTGIAIKEAQNYCESLYDYAPSSKPAQDYMELYGKLELE
jgi:chromosome partitioning protein